MIGGGIEANDRPKGEYQDRMVGPGAWPETPASVFANRSSQLGAIHKDLTQAKEGWQSDQSYLKSENTWAGVSATAANTKVDTHTKAMEAHEQQLTKAAGWCDEAAGLIGQVKETIRGTIKTALGVINDTLNDSDGENTDNAIGKIQDHANEWNKATVLWGAAKASGKEGVPDDPPAPKKRDFEKARDKSDDAEGNPGDISKSEDKPLFAFSNLADGGEGPGALPSPSPRTRPSPAAQEVSNVADAGPGPGYTPPSGPESGGIPPADAVSNVGDEGAGPGFVPSPVPQTTPSRPSPTPPAAGGAPTQTSPSPAPPSSGGAVGGGGGGGMSGGGGAPSP